MVTCTTTTNVKTGLFCCVQFLQFYLQSNIYHTIGGYRTHKKTANDSFHFFPAASVPENMELSESKQHHIVQIVSEQNESSTTAAASKRYENQEQDTIFIWFSRCWLILPIGVGVSEIVFALKYSQDKSYLNSY